MNENLVKTRLIRIDHRRRQGFLLVEMLVAMAFLAVATGVALRTHRAINEYDRSATERLRQQLVLENLAQQLSSVAFSDMESTAVELTDNTEVEIEIDPFESGATRGLHLVVRVDTAGGPLNHHLWRLESRQ
ncbi:type II secretion system GspH family protein [Stieleria sp. TO1_6]|uniref:prepilin-type N-terminal cleavage/methylation domain-containing protein n=1 Tax=Stieleria tagensis TaxID=2956795 RepID=UPI00209AACCA|nr:type II secretion system protein [Stieleria tagensis]MCO8125395.1 type II secretion system GspH family protein [Stieleria tagensis]